MPLADTEIRNAKILRALELLVFPLIGKFPVADLKNCRFADPVVDSRKENL
ncbi:hypothetical protein [Budvicia diplopodorum]|uniref:hypothetical protein n=1 Tax=Budvicia diplopodorum TaxID=1119056 RepID=UPI0014796278|nr:hypothetical protein [Budvicia diplopodorum]